jgi:CheY-like chemotaxis protein
MRGPAETATILLVDDDEGVRDLAYVVLASQGYSVRPVGSAEDAIEVVRREAAPIHLLLTDVMLEGLDGSQLARRLAELRPGIKVLYMSGYLEDPALAQGKGDGVAFLHKPFTPTGLLQAVKALLAT